MLLHAILTKKARIIYYASLYLKFFGLVSIIYSLVLVVVLFVLGYHWIDGMIFLVRATVGREAYEFVIYLLGVYCKSVMPILFFSVLYFYFAIVVKSHSEEVREEKSGPAVDAIPDKVEIA